MSKWATPRCRTSIYHFELYQFIFINSEYPLLLWQKIRIKISIYLFYRLIYVDFKMSKASLGRTSIYRFELYQFIFINLGYPILLGHKILIKISIYFIYRLLYVDVKMSKASLCRTSIYHFELYIASKPEDEDISRIRDAVANLRSRIDTYQKLDAIEDNFGRKID